MITDSFDNKSEAKINPKFNEDAYKLDVCILTFSNVIEEYVLNNYKCEKIGEIKDADALDRVRLSRFGQLDEEFIESKGIRNIYVANKIVEGYNFGRELTDDERKAILIAI